MGRLPLCGGDEENWIISSHKMNDRMWMPLRLAVGGGSPSLLSVSVIDIKSAKLSNANAHQ